MTMILNNTNLQAFYELSKTHNFTIAAKKLGITQSAFSQRIANLESELETNLVIRSKKGVIINDTGLKLIRHCEQVIGLETSFLNEFKSDNELKGIIRIAGFSSVMRSLVIPALSHILNKNSKVTIATHTLELDQLYELLKSSQVDFIVTNKVLNKDNLKSHFLGYEENVLAQNKKSKQEENIYLDHDERDFTTEAYFKLSKKKPPTNIRKRYLDDVYGLIDGIKLDLGKAVVPKHIIQNSKDIQILNPRTVLKVPVYLVYFDNPYYSELQKQVIESISQKVPGSLSQ
jgi:DNA-binding transcriptional LysR family regulator